MATQSFTDFVGRGQQNLYQGSAPTATVLPEQEIQRLLAELRRGGARAQNAMRILQSSPSGMQAIQAVSAPAPAPAPARPRPQTAQPTQAVDVQRPVPPRSTNIIGQTIGRGIGPPARAVGRGTGAFGRWLGEAFEQQAYGSGGAGAMARQHLLQEQPSRNLMDVFVAEHPIGKGMLGLARAAFPIRETPYDIAFKEARDSGMSMTDAFEAAREYSKQFDIGDEKTGYRGVSGFLRGVGDTLRGDLGITEPYVREGGTRRPMFTVGLADLASEVVNPMTILPGVGETRLVTTPAKQIPKIARGTRAGFTQFVQPSLEAAGRATGREALRQAERMPGGIPGVTRFADEPIIPPRQRPRLTDSYGEEIPRTKVAERPATGAGTKTINDAGETVFAASPGENVGFRNAKTGEILSYEEALIATAKESPNGIELLTRGNLVTGVDETGKKFIRPERAVDWLRTNGWKEVPVTPKTKVTPATTALQPDALGSGFELPSDLARSRVTPKFGRDAPPKNIVFESNFDRALYLATAKGTPKTASARANRETIRGLVREELEAVGLDPNKMDEIAAPMRQAVQDAAQATNKYDVEFEIFNYADEAALGRPRTTLDLSPEAYLKDPDILTDAAPTAAARGAGGVPNDFPIAARSVSGAPPEVTTAAGQEGVVMVSRQELAQLADPNVPIARLRQEERAYLDNLKSQISEQGLQQPLEVQRMENGNYMVMEGSHRLAVLEELGINEVPIRITQAPTTPVRQADAAARGVAGKKTLLSKLSSIKKEVIDRFILPADGAYEADKVRPLLETPIGQLSTEQLTSAARYANWYELSNSPGIGRVGEILNHHIDLEVSRRGLETIIDPDSATNVIFRTPAGAADVAPTGQAAARQVTPQQQAIIDDVGTGRPAGDLDVGARRITGTREELEAAEATAREVAEEGADVGDETYIAIQQGKEARAASAGKTREEQIALANRQRTNDSIGHTLAGGVSLKNLPPIEESLSGRWFAPEEVTPQNLDEIHKLAATNPEAIPPEVAKKAHIEKAAPDPGGSPPRRRQPPTGAIPEEPNELLKRAVDSKMPGERVDEALLREHVGAVRVAEGEARMAVDEGNDMLLALGWGSRKGKVLAPKTPEDIAIADSLHAALHGEGPVPAGYEEIVELARTQTNLEEVMRIDFDPKMATVEDYFFRGWKPPEEIAKATRDSSGNLVMRPGFEFARSGATYSEMRALGFEPLFWNPFEQINQSAKMGLRHRQQSQLIEALKQAGDEIIRPWDKGESGIPADWRIPKVGPAFEGKPFAAIDPATGKETVGWTRKWIVQNRVANKLENMYGKTPSMGSIHVGGRDIDLNKVIDTATFIPKQSKLFLSFFQDIDFLSRLGFGSFTGAVDALQRGQPLTAVKHLLSLPRGAAELLMARVPYQMVPARTKLGAKIGPARRRALRDSALKDTTPILEGRPGVNRRELMLSALNLRDRTILPPDMDKIVRDIATETGAMKVKSAARAVADFEKMLRDGLFEGTYPAVMWRDIISNIAPSMARMYPDLTDAQLVARIASVANTKYSTIPEVMSAIQNRVLRYGLLRLFFSIGESEGLLKQSLGVLTGPNKEFWTKHWLGGYVFLIASANAIHFASTGKGLPSERYSPVSKDSWGPLPFSYNTKFAAPDIPVGGEYGTAVRLDLVGQMDTAFRVLDPQSFVTSRFSVPVRAAMNQATGENFYGAPIDDVGPGGVVSRTAQLGLDMFSPIGVGGVAERVARETVPGAEDLIPKDPSGLSMTGEVIEATGLNLRASLRRNLLERQAMEQFQKPYEQLTQLELFKIKEDPDLKKKLMDMDIEASGRGDVFAEHRIAKNDIRVETRENKISLINTFVEDISDPEHKFSETRKKLNDLSKAITELSTGEYARLDQLRIEMAKREPKLTGWTGEPPTNDFDKMLNDWYAFYDDPKYKSSGVLDWDKLEPVRDKFIEKLSPELQGQLQEWRDRNDIPGLDDLRGLLGPRKRNGTPWEEEADGKKYYFGKSSGESLIAHISQLLPALGIQR